MRFMIAIVSVLALAGPEASAKRHKNGDNEPIQWGTVKQVDLGAMAGTPSAPTEGGSAPIADSVGQVLRQKPQALSSVGGTAPKTTGPKSELTSPGGPPNSQSKMDGKTEGQDPAMLPKQANLVNTQLGQLSQINATYVPGQGNTGTITINGRAYQVTETDPALAAQLFGQAKYYEEGGVNNRLTQVTGINAGQLGQKGILMVKFAPGVSLADIGVNAQNKRYYQPTSRQTQLALLNNRFNEDAGDVAFRPLYSRGRVIGYAPIAGGPGGGGQQAPAPPT
jgi:hypothetical protein